MNLGLPVCCLRKVLCKQNNITLEKFTPSLSKCAESQIKNKLKNASKFLFLVSKTFHEKIQIFVGVEKSWFWMLFEMLEITNHIRIILRKYLRWISCGKNNTECWIDWNNFRLDGETRSGEFEAIVKWILLDF